MPERHAEILDKLVLAAQLVVQSVEDVLAVDSFGREKP
jgi:hypothetical protein